MSEAERREADIEYVGAAPHPVTSTATHPPGANAGGRAAGSSAGSARGTPRPIGEILVAHGFASERELEDAVSEQQRTGQPLGQILVQNGVITRLELASALAEQWADQSTAALGAAHPPPRQFHPRNGEEDSRYAERLEEAVGDLARRLTVSEASAEGNARFTDLSSRLEGTMARTKRIEATVATLAARLDSVAGGVDETFAALQEGMSGLALDLARIDASVAEIGSSDTVPPATDPALAKELADLQAEVREVAERPVVDKAARDHVDRMAAQLDELAATTTRGDVEEAVDRLAARVEVLAGESGPAAELEAQSRLIAELRAALEGLVERPDLHPELDARLGCLETELAAGRADTAPVAALTERLEETVGEQEALATWISGLGTRIEELAHRLDATAAAQGGLTTSIDAHRARVDALAQRLDTTTTTHDDLAAAVDQHVARIETLAQRLDAAATHDDVAAAVDQHAARVETLAQRLDATTATQNELTASIDRLAAQVVELAARQPEVDATSSIEPRLAQMEQTVQSIREAASVPAAALSERLEEIEARIDALPAQPAGGEVTAANLADVEARLRSELVTTDEFARTLARHESAGSASDGRLDALAHDVSNLRVDFAEITQLEGRRSNQPTMQHVEQILGKLEALETRVSHDVVGTAALTRALADLRSELAADHSAPTPADLREEIASQVAELGRALTERRPTDTASRAADGGQPADLEQSLERTRMALERIGLHLGEHDRALAELMRTRVVTQRLDELAARIDDLAAASPAVRRALDGGAGTGETPVGMQALINRIAEVEQSNERDREKLMTRLERMASALDWRLQRLESGDAA